MRTLTALKEDVTSLTNLVKKKLPTPKKYKVIIEFPGQPCQELHNVTSVEHLGTFAFIQVEKM